MKNICINMFNSYFWNIYFIRNINILVFYYYKNDLLLNYRNINLFS